MFFKKACKELRFCVCKVCDFEVTEQFTWFLGRTLENSLSSGNSHRYIEGTMG